ncbi:hypothetical protein [Methylovulum psychrotolerans]|uniref:Uncharacterized protein n=1 Tax=Methylovulum psychrotolerans TaxID=1704499 RepID=A0A1Z4C3V5_9GAMM|nr:hypothetical protein [Methylovulum psychrotolerans]ASF48199.1 hypothetical protein CEK71_20225 [Methylovulum psychrotolerans]
MQRLRIPPIYKILVKFKIGIAFLFIAAMPIYADATDNRSAQQTTLYLKKSENWHDVFINQSDHPFEIEIVNEDRTGDYPTYTRCVLIVDSNKICSLTTKQRNNPIEILLDVRGATRVFRISSGCKLQVRTDSDNARLKFLKTDSSIPDEESMQ